MKTRSGFVSNSSSTSFTIIVSPDTFKSVRQMVSEDARKIMDVAWSNPSVFKVGDVTLWDISFIDYDGDYWQYVGNNVYGSLGGYKLERGESVDLGSEIIKKLMEKGAYVRTKGC